MRRVRILPLAMVGVASLFALKATALVLNGGLAWPGIAEAVAQTNEAAAQDGAAKTSDAQGEAGKGQPAALPPAPQGRLVKPGEDVVGSKAAVLERLGERSKELDARERELDLKDNLLKAAEKRIALQLEELRAIKSVIEAAVKKEEERKKGQLKGLVTMYENMKPKDAARIFNELSLPVLVELVDQMDARKMAEILAKMNSGPAERVTVELARRANDGEDGVKPLGELPKIQGNNPT